jgi:Rrf2 family protein
MRLSKRCEHGLKAAVQLALHSSDGYLQAKEIAEAEELPGKFIESILSSLRAASILESKVGAKGGYRLARPANEIFIADLIASLETDLQSGRADDEDMTPGASALALLNRRIDASLASAMSGLTLEDVTGLHSIRADQNGQASREDEQDTALAGCASDG